MKVKKIYNFKDFEYLLQISNFKGWETSHIGLRASRKSMKKKTPESPDLVTKMKNILSCLKEMGKYQIFNIYLISYDNLTA